MALMMCSTLMLVVVLLSNLDYSSAQGQFKKVGPLTQRQHNVQGDVFDLDHGDIIEIRNFYYDGSDNNVYFVVGTKEASRDRPSSLGIRIPDENNNTNPLNSYNGQTIQLFLPQNVVSEVEHVTWLSVWSFGSNISYGEVFFDYHPHCIDDFVTHSHGVAGSVHAINPITLLVDNFTYDGQGPAAFFWIGDTDNRRPNGNDSHVFVGLVDDRGNNPLQEYDGTDVTLTLRAPYTINNIKWLIVWCAPQQANLGEVGFPGDGQCNSSDRLGSTMFYFLPIIVLGIFAYILQKN